MVIKLDGGWLGRGYKEYATPEEAIASFTHAIVDVINGSENPFETANDLLNELKSAELKSDDSKLKKLSNFESLKKWIPNTPEKLAVYIVIFDIVIRLLLAHPDKDIEYNTVFNNFSQIVVVQEQKGMSEEERAEVIKSLNEKEP